MVKTHSRSNVRTGRGGGTTASRVKDLERPSTNEMILTQSLTWMETNCHIPLSEGQQVLYLCLC